MLFEQNKLPSNEIKELFSELVRTGDVWNLPDDYINIAAALLEQGLLTDVQRVIQ